MGCCHIYERGQILTISCNIYSLSHIIILEEIDLLHELYLLFYTTLCIHHYIQIILDGCFKLTNITIKNIVSAMPSVKRLSMCGTNVTRRLIYEGVDILLSGCPVLPSIENIEDLKSCEN